jgi:hypothetical protein
MNLDDPNNKIGIKKEILKILLKKLDGNSLII